MVENALAKTLVEGQPVRGGEIDPRLPFLGAVVFQRFRRNPELHGYPPCCVAVMRRALYARHCSVLSLPG